MPGERGPITVFFMPGEMTASTLPVQSARFSGKVVPASWGSIAVVGEAGEPLDGLAERLASKVDWPSEGLAVSGPVGGRLLVATGITQKQDG